MDIFEKRLRYTLTNKIATIILVGCGGTGGFLAQNIARIIYSLKNQRKISAIFVDDDKVEPKNIGRQNFCVSEIGMYKSETLARRFNLAYGLDIMSYTARFTSDFKERVNTPLIVIGAVDNTIARKEIYHFCSNEQRGVKIWLDCGNENNSGQVLLGDSHCIDTNKFIKTKSLGIIESLPFPSIQHPELIEEEEKKRPSCAEEMERGAQGLLINQMISAYASQYLYELLTVGQTDKFATYVNLKTCSARTEYITERKMEKYLETSISIKVRKL